MLRLPPLDSDEALVDVDVFSVSLPPQHVIDSVPGLQEIVRDAQRVIEVASSTYGGCTPAPRQHDPESVSAGIIREHALFWQYVLLPNAGLPPQEQARILGWVTHGVTWGEFAAKHDANPTIATDPALRLPNHAIKGRAPDGQPLEEWVDDTIGKYVSIGVLQPHHDPDVLSPIGVEPLKPRCDVALAEVTPFPPQNRIHVLPCTQDDPRFPCL